MAWNSTFKKLRSWQLVPSLPEIRRGKSGNSDMFCLLELKNHCWQWLQSWNYKTLAPWKETITNLGSILKSKVITLLTKVHKVKAMVFPVVYEYERWTIKKAEQQGINAFELWCWRKLLRVPWTVRRSNQSILKEINPEIFIGRTDAEAEAPILGLPDGEGRLIGKDADWKIEDWRLKAKEEEGNRGWDVR